MSGKEKINGLKKKISGVLDMPSEVVLNLPLITIVGQDEVNIENFKNIIEYGDERIRIDTTCGVLRLCGRNLVLKTITDERIVVRGKLTALEYMI